MTPLFYTEATQNALLSAVSSGSNGEVWVLQFGLWSLGYVHLWMLSLRRHRRFALLSVLCVPGITEGTTPGFWCSKSTKNETQTEGTTEQRQAQGCRKSESGKDYLSQRPHNVSSFSITVYVFQLQNEVLLASQHSHLTRQLVKNKKFLNQPIRVLLLKFLSRFLFYKIICVWVRWPGAIHICSTDTEGRNGWHGELFSLYSESTLAHGHACVQ